MSKSTLQSRLKRAIAETNTNSPIRRVIDHAGGGLTLHLRHGVLDWPVVTHPDLPEDNRVTIPKPKDDLTAITGIGLTNAAKLIATGRHTFEDIRTTEYADLVLVVGTYAADKIVTYFKDHYP